MNSLVFGILAVCFVGACVTAVKIQFFRNENLTDINYESNSTAKCSNVPADKKDVIIKSIKTDTCLMVYNYPNCKLDYTRKFDLDNILGWNMAVGSFHICNEDIGGLQLKIDITKYWDFRESSVLESYRDVCKCINVPQYVQSMSYWTTNNYGNGFLAFYQPNCFESKWKAESIPAGQWCSLGSNCMQEYIKTDNVTNTTYKIQSIGPNPNSKYFKTSCSQISINNELMAKDEQLEKQIQTISTEILALENASVELESKLEVHFRSSEDSIEKLKDEFDNFVLKLDHKLSKLVSD